VHLGVISALVTLFEPVVRVTLNLVFGRGIDISWLLKKIGLDFIIFEKTLLNPMDGYFLFYLTPGFDLEYLNEDV